LTANGQTGAATIDFNLPGSGPYTIAIASALPTITNSTLVDGTSQPGYDSSPLIDVDGTSAGSANGFLITAANCTVKGLDITHFADQGIYVTGTAATGNLIAGNYIGVGLDGQSAAANGQYGVIMENAANNTIGGSAAAQNVISGNSAGGVAIFGKSATGAVVQDNRIGTDVTGTVALGNAFSGIFVGDFNNGEGAASGALVSDNLVSGNGGSGIFIDGTGANNNTVQGNEVGTTADGTSALGNAFWGVIVEQGASNTIGLTPAGPGNVVSGNKQGGVAVYGATATGNDVLGNRIGTDATGTMALGNAYSGVFVGDWGNGEGAASGTLVSNNVIASNGNTGVWINGTGANDNTVQSNSIGTNTAGTSALGNTFWGVVVEEGAGNTIGGTVLGDGNLISGNQEGGVAVYGSAATGNAIEQNNIGVDENGTKALGNVYSGIFVGDWGNGQGAASGALISGNLISANGNWGVWITGNGAKNNVVETNKIGTNAAGTGALPNAYDGVNLSNGAQSNQIGSPGLGNIIAFNTGAGVAVHDPTTTGNSIRGNSIFGNGSLGIDMNGDGVTLNNTGNVDSGPNHLQNYPVLLSATPGNSTTVSGTLNSLASTAFTLDFYSSPAPDITFFGPGETYLGSVTVTTGSTGNASFTVHLSAATTAGQWITATATDPSGNTSEFSGARQLPASPLPLNATQWTAIGPAPITDQEDNGPVDAGRVTMAVPDPANSKVMYIATDGGGIWKTTNWLSASPTWTPLTDSQPSLNTGGGNTAYKPLAFVPGNPGTLYVAASGPGGGILASTDGGTTWTEKGNSVFDHAAFGTLLVDPTAPSTLYVTVWYGASGGGGVYKSIDGGNTWTNTTAGITTGAASDLTMDPTNSAVLYTGLAQDGAVNGIYKTTNSGATWTLLSSQPVSAANVGDSIRLVIAPSNHLTIYTTVFDTTLGNGTSGEPHRFVSFDGGNSWSPLNSLPAADELRYWHVVLTVDPTNPQIVYVNGDHELYQSTDGGAVWNSLYGEDPVGAYFDASSALVLVGDRGIYRWAGAGSPFANKQGNLQDAELYTVTLDPSNPKVAYGISQDQLAGMKFSGLPTWNYLGGGDEVGKILVDPQNSAVLYTYDPLWTDSFILKSTDGGAMWSASGTGIPTTDNGYNLAYSAQKAFVMDPTNHDRLLVGVDVVYESTDAGASWHPLGSALSPGQFITALAIAPSQPNTVYAATADGKVFVTTNDGSTWQEHDTGLPVDFFDQIVDIEVDPTNPNHAFVVPGRFPTNVYGSAHVWTTTNGGATWSDITGNLPADDYTNALAVDWRFATPILYVGTARGVFRSLNGGTTWAPFETGLPNVNVTDLQFLPQYDLLAAATYGRGVFEILAAGPATHFTISAPTSVTAGTPFTFTVSARDSMGALAVTYTGTVHFTSGDPRKTLPGDYTFTSADNGIHSFTATLRTTPSQTIMATDTVHSSITGTQTIQVTPAAVTHFNVALFPSPEQAGVSATFRVIARDAYNNTVTSYTGTVHFTTSDPNSAVRLPANYTFTSSDKGIHTFHATLVTAGTQSLTATDTVNSSISGSQTGIVITPAAMNHFRVFGFPNPTVSGVMHMFTVQAKDIYGNIVTGYTGTIRFSSSDSNAMLPGPYTFTAGDAGVHTFTGALLSQGTQSITVTDTVNSSLTGSQTGIMVNPSGVSRFSPGAPAQGGSGPQTGSTAVQLVALPNHALLLPGSFGSNSPLNMRRAEWQDLCIGTWPDVANRHVVDLLTVWSLAKKHRLTTDQLFELANTGEEFLLIGPAVGLAGPMG
jgi:hypothetical protein